MMPLIIRIDVDNPFNWQERNQKVFNYISLNWTSKINWTWLGYLKCAHKFHDFLVKHEIPVTWFYTSFTLPDKVFLAQFRESDHGIALHAVQTDNWENFKKELEKINHYLGEPVRGFSKHGSGQRKLSKHHSPEYEELKFLEFARRAKLKYFIGNGEEPSEKELYQNSTIYWSNCFWANPAYRNENRYNHKWLEEQADKSEIVFLIHPGGWYFNMEVRKIMDWIVENINDFSMPSD